MARGSAVLLQRRAVGEEREGEDERGYGQGDEDVAHEHEIEDGEHQGEHPVEDGLLLVFLRHPRVLGHAGSADSELAIAFRYPEPAEDADVGAENWVIHIQRGGGFGLAAEAAL